jgi:hypothetical protein
VSATAAAGPYEPNDAIPTAAGPLALGQTYAGGIETGGDKDFFSFYVTARAPAPVTIAIKDLGGGNGLSDLDAAIVNPLGTAISSLPYIGDGEERTTTVALPPQKYYLEVWSNEGFGDSYSFSTGGIAGAFGPYSQIAGRCSTATKAATAAQAKLSRAETRLQRATSLVRRSRYASPKVRARAHAQKHRARAQVRALRVELREATASQQPWCSIPQ